VDPVGSHVTVARPDDHGENRRLPAFGCVDRAGERGEARGGFVDAIGAEPDLERVPALARVDDRADLEPGLVTDGKQVPADEQIRAVRALRTRQTDATDGRGSLSALSPSATPGKLVEVKWTSWRN